MNQPSIAFFDLDHTLVDGDSDTSFLDYMGEHGLLSPEVQSEKDVIHRAYLAGEPWQPMYRILLKKIFAGRSFDEMTVLGRAHAKERVLPMLFSGARDLIETERARRTQICLLTATNQIVTAPLAEELGFDALLPTWLAVVDGTLTGELAGDFCAGPGKEAALRLQCTKMGIEPGACAMFGDGRSDMDALDAVGEPVAVHPTEVLRERALERGWRVLDLS